jgi:hypothetical protein
MPCKLKPATLRGVISYYQLLRILRDIADVLLWLSHKLGLCCATVGESAMYTGCRLVTHPNLVTLCMAYHPRKLSPKFPFYYKFSIHQRFLFNVYIFFYYTVNNPEQALV